MNKQERKYWFIWYAGVLLFLLVEILVFAWLTQLFS